MQMTEFCDHLYNNSIDGYIQILKLNDENNIGIDEKYDRNNERRRKSRRNEEGLSNRAIGKKLSISEGKVRTTLKK